MRIITIPKLIYIFVTCTLLACSSIDYHLTEFRPKEQTPEYQIYEYKSFADAVYPNDSENAEQTRMQWLEKWIKNNGHKDASYEVLSRKPVVRQVGAFGTIYDIYYEIKVKR